MLEIASKYAQADDDARDGEGAVDLANARRPGAKQKTPHEGGTSNEVAAAFEGKGGKQKWKAKGKDVAPAKTRLEDESVKNQPCPIHAALGKVNHTLGECRFMDDIKKDPDVG